MFCSACGASINCADRFCPGCGTSLGATISDARLHPAGPLLPVGSAPGFASLGLRVVATMIDLTACWCVIALLVIMIPMHLVEDGFARKGWPTLIPIGLCSVALSYYILFEALFGATLGKATTGIQVRLRDGDACGFRAALIRNMLRPIDAFGGYLLGFVVALLSASRQRLGDVFAGTIVVSQATPVVIRLVLVAAWLALGSGTFVASQVMTRY